MRKNIRIAAALASLAVVTSIAAPAVSATAEPTATQYKANTNGTAVYIGTDTTAWRADAVTNDASVSKTSYNATEFKKVLEIEDTASIPEVNFKYEVTVPDSHIPATYDGNQVATLAVYKGQTPEKIIYRVENITNGTKVFQTADYGTYTTATAAETGKNGFQLAYASNDVSLPAEGDTKKADHDDNVLIYNAKATEGKSGVNTYYAIKTVQMDFSEVKFTEPGIYRYYIEETGDNQGVTNDYENQTNGAEVANVTRWRTLDVYVEDAGLINAENKLVITGYVMYVGKLETGPKAGDATINPTVADNMEDGVAHTNPSGNGGANGVEVDGAEKSEGIRNLYDTNDITFKKTVSGNQASKDKFFKFNLKLTAGDIANVGDGDKFIISTDSTHKIIPTWDGVTTTPNFATPYSQDTIYDGNNAAVDSTSQVRYVTGAQLKATDGYSFYIQDGQQVKITGIPAGVGYELWEYQDDYNATLAEIDGDKLNGGADSTTDVEMALTVSKDGNINADTNIAKIKDTVLVDDVSVRFNNDRTGHIPTGVILSVAAPATIGIAVVGGIIYLVAKRKKDEDDEEE